MTAWPADNPERWDIEHVRASPANARTHPEGQVDRIAALMRENGWTMPLLVDESGELIAGHGRLLAAQRNGWSEVPVVVARGWSEQQKRAYRIADNKIAQQAGWDDETLAAEIAALEGSVDLEAIGFSQREVDALLAAEGEEDARQGKDEIPPQPEEPVTRAGDVWIMGRHRIVCGDCRSPEALTALMRGEVAGMIHADPPYGMGKQADGVENDNLYEERLDAFQLEWWHAVRQHVSDNGSAYIWGNAADLWRLWYVGGLKDREPLFVRNEIVWDKSSIAGRRSELMTQYPIASERCLFIQIGDQFLGNVNQDQFPESWEPIRGYMASQAEAAGITPKDIKRVCDCQMYAHWFTRSQFTLMPERHYRALADAYPGHFERPWRELKAEWDRVKGGPTSELQGARSYFDNAHDSMTDVWRFDRVYGAERYGHATPKPVEMIQRPLRSSVARGGTIIEPFAGSGSTIIAAESIGRSCYAVEITPGYVDVCVKRWEGRTDAEAVLEGDGRTFAEVAAERIGRQGETGPADNGPEHEEGTDHENPET